MKLMRKGLTLCSVFVVALGLSGCSSEESAGHDQNLGGVLHRAGYLNPPAAGCPACHGADLRGGTGPSCYSCHDTVNI